MYLVLTAAIAITAIAWGYFAIQNRSNPAFLAKFAPRVDPADYPVQSRKFLTQGVFSLLVGFIVLTITYLRYRLT